MTQVTDPTSTAPQPQAEPDLAAEVRRVLEASSEPLTLSKIRAGLPGRLRSVTLEALAEGLQRQVAAHTLIQYPKYRSQQDRFWDRPMNVHIACLLRQTLEEEGPLPWSELRRKLPDYAKSTAEAVLDDQVQQGLLHRHPPTSSRGGPRFGVRPPEAREYLRGELSAAFSRLEKLGFSRAQLREGAMELLQEEEWDKPVAAAGEPAGAAASSESGEPQTAPPERRGEHPAHASFEGPHKTERAEAMQRSAGQGE
jgi:hypothetical protein